MTGIEDRVVAAPTSNIAPEMLAGPKKESTWMSQEVGKWTVNGLIINGVYWGFNPFTG